MTCFVALAVLVLAGGVRAEEPAPANGQLAEGLALEITVKQTLAVVSSGSSNSINNSIILGQPVGKLFLGRKIGKVIFGAGLELARLSGDFTSSASSSSSQTQVLFIPGLRWTFASSADQRVEALLAVNLGIGHTFSDSTPSSGSTSTASNYRIVYEAGPAVRFWLHPQFALGATTGLRGDYIHQSVDNPSFPVSGSSSTVGLTSVFTALDLLGVF